MGTALFAVFLGVFALLAVPALTLRPVVLAAGRGGGEIVAVWHSHVEVGA